MGLIVFFAFDSSQPVNAPDDQGLGLGAMLVTAALAPVIALFLWVGGGLAGWVEVLEFLFVAGGGTPGFEPLSTNSDADPAVGGTWRNESQ